MEVYIEQVKNYSIELTKAINRLLKQLNTDASLLTDDEVKTMIASQANRLFVARKLEGKEIVGMLNLIAFRIPFAKKGLLEDMVVDKKYRGKGIGTRLISAAIDQARQEELKYIDFTSNPMRVEANKLYQRLGFEKRDTNAYRIKL